MSEPNDSVETASNRLKRKVENAENTIEEDERDAIASAD
jgi:hypothetical protein